jgi:GT2 family glycosyltransferase
LAPREVFQYIKGFVKPYPFGWYEDEELSHRMRAYGFKLGVSGRSWIHHEGGATVKTIVGEDPKVREIMESNRERCIADMKRTKQVAQDVASRIPHRARK